MTHRQAVDELFSNITWTAGQADDLDDEEILGHWKHPSTNIYVTLVLFIIMNVRVLLFNKQIDFHWSEHDHMISEKHEENYLQIF